MEISGAVVIVTGASGGIGRETGRLLAENGAKVALAARSADKLEALHASLAQKGCQTLVVRTDVTQREEVDALVSRTVSHFGRLDILINNAGQSARAPLEKMPVEVYRALIELNVFGPLYAIQAALPVMRAQGGGLIMNVSSMTSRQLWPGLGAYASTKHALNCLSETLRLEVAMDNIRVTNVIPDGTVTEFSQNMLMNVAPPAGTSRPEGARSTRDSADFVAGKILEAIRTEPAEQYMY